MKEQKKETQTRNDFIAQRFKHKQQPSVPISTRLSNVQNKGTKTAARFVNHGRPPSISSTLVETLAVGISISQ